MNWVQRKIYLYNVTFGLYMLDWWERYLFNTLVIVLMWFVFDNSSRYVTEFYKSNKEIFLRELISNASDACIRFKKQTKWLRNSCLLPNKFVIVFLLVRY